MFDEDLQKSDVELEEQYVAVLNHVFLTFVPCFACFFCRSLTTQFNIVVVADGLCANEAALKVGVDDASGLRSLCADRYGPCAGFFWSCCEVGDQVQQVVACADQAIQTRLFQPHVRHVFTLFFFIQLCNLCFDCCGDDNRCSALLFCHG